MKTMTRFKGVWIVIMALVMCLPTVRAVTKAPEVLSAEQVLNETGQTIAKRGAQWWQWAFENPDVLFDTSGKFAALGDVGGPVFFREGSGADPVRVRLYLPGAV